MAPNGVSIHAARVRRDRREDPRLFAEPSRIDSAVELLAAVKPHSIIYAFASSSYVLGVDGDEALRIRLERVAGGIPVILAAAAASAALRAVNARRVAIVHPPWFSEETNDKGKAYFQGQGFAVLSCARVLPLRDFRRCLRRKYTAGWQRPYRRRQTRCSLPVTGYEPLASLTPLRKL
jgi:maleate isomerase